MARAARDPIEIGGVSIAPGEHRTVNIPVAPLYTHDDLSISVQVIHGRQPGPVVFTCAAVHGDEINGVEIIRRLLKHRALRSIRGTLLSIPIVNVYGFLNHSRYMPDGRDLNRAFPGSEAGSLAARVANTFLREIVLKSDYGIDLHTGARHRANFPQIRADLDMPEARRMTEAFAVPLALDSKLRDGSLREAAGDAGIPVILYEAGEALRFDEVYIRAGLAGIINVLREIGVLRPSRRQRPLPKPIVSDQSSWLRAPESGILSTRIALGAKVVAGQTLAIVADPLGDRESPMIATHDGIVIGRTRLPLVYEGDAVFHIARYGRRTAAVEKHLEQFQEEYETQLTRDGDILG